MSKMMKDVDPEEFEHFLSAVAERTGKARNEIGPDTKLWADLELWGSEYVWTMMEVQKILGYRLNTDLEIFEYIPDESERGWFGKLRIKRDIPDITLRNLYENCWIER